MRHPLLAALLPALFLAPGCARSRDVPGHLTYLPNGAPAYAITCDGPFEDMQSCYTRAGKICLETGYEVISASNRAADLPEFLAQFKRRLLIHCRTPDGLYPADRRRRPE